MFWFRLSNDNDDVIHVTDQFPEWFKTPPEWRPKQAEQQRWINRNDIQSFEQAESLARSATVREALEGGSRQFIATDAGNGCWPQFDVIVAPQVGDVVSKGFNGDYYPVGTITKIGKNLKRITVTNDHGHVETFSRRRLSGRWTDGTFTLVRGTRDERNPHF